MGANVQGGQTYYDSAIGSIADFANSYVFPLLLTIAIAVFMVLGIINGIKFAKAGTDEERVKAKKSLIYLVIGVVITMASIWLFDSLSEFLMAVFEVSEPVQVN